MRYFESWCRHCTCWADVAPAGCNRARSSTPAARQPLFPHIYPIGEWGRGGAYHATRHQPQRHSGKTSCTRHTNIRACTSSVDYATHAAILWCGKGSHCVATDTSERLLHGRCSGVAAARTFGAVLLLSCSRSPTPHTYAVNRKAHSHSIVGSPWHLKHHHRQSAPLLPCPSHPRKLHLVHLLLGTLLGTRP